MWNIYILYFMIFIKYVKDCILISLQIGNGILFTVYNPQWYPQAIIAYAVEYIKVDGHFLRTY